MLFYMMSYFAHRRPHRPRTAVLSLVLTLALVLVSCGGDDDGASGDNFNDADVTFAQNMIAHHQQAIAMAKLVPTRAESQEVKDLGEKIEAAQGPEIETMTGWLDEWGEPTKAEGMDGPGDMGAGDGMMSEEDMSSLMDAEGAEFDRMFLEMMTKHHEGAVEMAQAEVDDGKNAEAKELAEKIIADQTKEIGEMDDLLKSL